MRAPGGEPSRTWSKPKRVSNNPTNVVGYRAGAGAERNNTIVGSLALSTTRGGADNTVVGPTHSNVTRQAGRREFDSWKRDAEALVTGSKHRHRLQAGSSNSAGSGNVYIGAFAGSEKPTRESNKLYIANSKEQTPSREDFGKRTSSFTLP